MPTEMCIHSAQSTWEPGCLFLLVFCLRKFCFIFNSQLSYCCNHNFWMKLFCFLLCLCGLLIWNYSDAEFYVVQHKTADKSMVLIKKQVFRNFWSKFSKCPNSVAYYRAQLTMCCTPWHQGHFQVVKVVDLWYWSGKLRFSVHALIFLIPRALKVLLLW